MKIRLAVGADRYDRIKEYLENHGIELDDDSDYILIEKSRSADRLPVRDVRSSEKSYIRAEDIIYLESFGHDVYIHAVSGEYVTNEPLYQLELMLDPERFVRVSASVITAHPHIREIRPALSRKYVLYLSNGAVVDVTRSYYNAFKERFGL